MKISLSCDDGCVSDIALASLAKKYNIPCVFYWPLDWHTLAHANGYEPLSYADALNIASIHEVGAHTISHRHLTKIPINEALYEIKAPKWFLGDLFHQEITKFAPPRGYTNETLTKYTLGIYESQRLTKGKGLIHIHPNSGANDNLPWKEVAIKALEEGDVELWGHSFEFDRFGLWEDIGRFLDENSNR